MEFNVPRIKFREKNPEYYPKEFISKPEKGEISFLTYGDEKTKEYFEKLTLDNFYKDFPSNSKFYDLHNQDFQNFSIRSTNGMSGQQLRELSISRDAARKRLLRARVYGISTQSEWGWDGSHISKDEISKREEKTKEIQIIHETFKLYDWSLQPSDFELPKPRFERTRYRFFREGTQECLLQLHSEFNIQNTEKDKNVEEIEGEEEEEEEERDNRSHVNIAWLNLANAHHVCGIYSSSVGGSQEEEVATNCTGCSTLGTCGDFYHSGPRSWFLGKSVHYKNGWHIPPGGNYFCKTKFLTGQPLPVDCFMIASAFCDLRRKIPYVFQNTERGDYYDIWGNLKKSKNKKKSFLEERLFFDIEGCIRTAIFEKIDVLVAGASGCGAFKHDPRLEAEIWHQVIQKYQGYLMEVVFAVLDKEDSDNVKYFKEKFSGGDE